MRRAFVLSLLCAAEGCSLIDAARGVQGADALTADAAAVDAADDAARGDAPSNDGAPGDSGTIDGAVSDASFGDGGTTDGAVFPSSCRNDTDCMVSGAACVTGQGLGAFTRCGGTCTDGHCELECDPFRPNTCPGAQVCACQCSFIRPRTTGNPAGVCRDPIQGGGGLEGAGCSGVFSGDTYVGSDCELSYECRSSTSMNPGGVCARMCRVGDDSVCPLGYHCINDFDPASTIGQCVMSPPLFSDIGASCTSSAACMGGICSSLEHNSCSADCSMLVPCPSRSLCIIPDGSPAHCAKACTPTAPNCPNPASACRALPNDANHGVCL